MAEPHRSPGSPTQPRRTSGKSPRNTSFDSYRSSPTGESDSETEDRVDHSPSTAANLDGSREDSHVDQSPHVDQSARVTRRTAKAKKNSIYGRRPLHHSPARSPTDSTNNVQDDTTITPPRIGSPYAAGSPPISGGTPSPYKDLMEQVQELKEEANAASPALKGVRARPQTARQFNDSDKWSSRSPTNRGRKVTGSPAQSPPRFTAVPPAAMQCKDSTAIFFVIVGIVLVVVFAIGFYLIALQPSAPATNQYEETPMSRLKFRLSELKAMFPHQEERFWQVLRASTKRVILDEQPVKPGVVMIGSTPNTRREADCIARHFGNAVKETFEAGPPVMIDALTDYVRMTPNDAKIAMDDSLRSGFSGSARSAVITSLEELHGQTAMLLHAFCDNDNAPYTKVVIVFTLHTQEQTLNARDDSKIEECLTRSWQPHLNYDDINALLSRVANNIAVVSKETSEVMAKHCSG